MSRKTIILLVIIISLVVIAAIVTTAVLVSKKKDDKKNTNNNFYPVDENEDGDEDGNEIEPETYTEIQDIIADYYNPSSQPGTLEEFYYDTYESRTYNSKSKKLNKRAIIYLPYGYSSNNKYNVLYLMHGGWSNEETSLGTPSSPGPFKHIIDNYISHGVLKPLIIVCPTYNNESPNDSSDYTLAYYTLTVNYHNELSNDLIPAVEGKYSTYASSTSDEDIISSREHRAFGGFSMGSVCSWYTFVNCLDRFKYFITSSGAISKETIDESVAKQGKTKNDFFIMSFTGSGDFARTEFTNLINNLLSSSSGNFINGTNENNGNLYFRIKNGFSHDHTAFMTYMYNGLLGFWKNTEENNIFTLDSTTEQVINDAYFTGFGRLIFPVHRNIPSNTKLKDIGSYYIWYNYINSDKTVEIVNYLRNSAKSGNTIFYDIYTDEEKSADSEKANTGLFFFKGNDSEKFAIVSAGGGFSYVGAMHDSFPHCLELSKKGYNAFALIYRPNQQKACEDLSRAINFIFENRDKLKVDTKKYSLWGGSAGARMAALVGTHGTKYYGENQRDKAGTVVMQYTGFTEVTGEEPPTYNCVGTNDGIASYQTMQNRINRIKEYGINTRIDIFNGLPHGFGLGQGTIAEGWINNAIEFWHNNMN